jgi:hypothetical protein
VSGAALIPSLLPLFMVAMMRRAEERLHLQLASAGALSAESAIPLSPTRSIERRRLQGLIQGGAVRLTADGRHFLDADGWNRHHRNRMRRALFALCVAVALIGVAVGVALVLR